MLKNTELNRVVTKTIARALGTLNENVVYVGGAVVSFYIDDPSAEDVRPTKDIDLSMEIANLGELELIRQELTSKGFYQSSEDQVICRFRYEDILVDVMATRAVGWAPANPWFAPGFNKLIKVKVDDVDIKCLSLPYFLASKFTAFFDRGGSDPRISHDFEDIVYLLNYSSTVVEQIHNAPQDVKQYLLNCFSDVLSDKLKQEAIIANLFYEDQDRRYKKIIEKIKQIID